jgi:DNA-directed RNA polymerase subunit RPC12/RpoP
MSDIVCQKCGSANAVSDEAAGEGGAEIRCEQCGEKIPVEEQKPSVEPASGGADAGGTAEDSTGERKAAAKESEKEGPKFNTETVRDLASKSKPEPSIEDSGIVDVVKLLSAARAAGGEAQQPAGGDSALLGVKRPAVGPLSVAPEEAKKKGKGGTTIYAILAAGVVIGVAIVGAAWILKPGLQPIAGLEPNEGQQQAEATGPAETEPEAQPAEQPAPEQQSAGSEKAEPDEEKDKPARVRNREKESASASPDRGQGKTSRPAGEGGKKTETEPGSEQADETATTTETEQTGETAAAAETEPAEETAAKKPSADNRSMESLLDNAVVVAPIGSAKNEPGTAAAAKPARALPKKPSRDQVLDALRKVQRKVSACAGGRKGTAMTAIKVGSNGRVKSAKVSNVEEPVASCIEKAVGEARFPEFSDDEFSVNFPFML